MSGHPGYPWREGDPLFADALNEAVANSAANLSLTTTASSNPNPSYENVWTFNGTGGVNTTVDVQSRNYVGINSAVGQSVWANRDELNYNSPTASTTNASYVARTMHTVAYSDRGSAAGAPQIWGAIIDAVDTTGHPSSVAGNVLTLEVDVEAGGLDDANIRQGIVVVGATRDYPTVPTSEFLSGISVHSADVGATFKNQMVLSGRFNTAGINFTQSLSIGSAPAIWLNTGQSIAFDASKNLQFRWEAARSQYEYQWLGSPVWSINPAGDVVMGPGTTRINGTVGFNNTAPIAKPTVTGAKAGNAALASLLTALAAYGLITDSSS